MKTYIVATDYSKDAENALEYAASLARYTKAKIILFNAFQLPSHMAGAGLTSSAIDVLLEENRNRLKSIAAKVSRFHGVEIEEYTSHCQVEEELDLLVEVYKADLVVMGMRGCSLSNKISGNTTTSVVRHSGYPVLVVPEWAFFQKINRILFACDYSSLSRNDTLAVMKQLADDFHAQVQVLHVEEEFELAGQSRRNRVASLDGMLKDVPHIYREMEAINTIAGIERGLQEYKAELLVMMPHKTGMWESMLHSSVTCEMALRTYVPLLAIPNGKLKSF